MAKRAIATFIFICFMSIFIIAQDRSIRDHVAVFSSPDVSGVSKERVVLCLQQLVHEWHLSKKEMPNIVVINASRTAAESAFVFKKVSIRTNGSSENRSQYFEVWLVGEPNIPNIVWALENVMEIHFSLKIADMDRNAIVARVTRMQMSTVGETEMALRASKSR